MKRFLPLVLVASLALAGCGTLGALTKPITNLTPQQFAVVESGYGLILAVAVNYRRACEEGDFPASCRTTITKLQPYGLKAQKAVLAARGFIKKNDSFNAITAIKAAQAAIADFRSVCWTDGGCRSVAIANGVM